MKYLAFDLEIVKVIPPDCNDWWSLGNLGISCAVAQPSDSRDAIVWAGWNELGPVGARAVVNALINMAKEGYTLVGFNSLGFDLRVLGQESGMVNECKWLAAQHIDLYWHIFCAMGYGPGLDRLAKGMGLPGKTAGMDGAKAPELWAQGQRQKVIDYCVQDTRLTMDLFRLGNEMGGVQWKSKAGKTIVYDFECWLNTMAAQNLPQPDTSWMTEARSREQSAGWLK